MSEQEDTLLKVGVTGGPCGGKSVTVSDLRQELPEHGVQPLVVPEAARMLIASGITPAILGPQGFQETIMKTQIALEDTYQKAYREHKNSTAKQTVLLCDRGVMDSRAYIPEPEFMQILEKNAWTIPDLRDKRYDAVIHLVTAANGAEAFYAADTERSETPAQAIELDVKTQQAWVGHPHLSVIGNNTDFAGKKRRVLNQILHHLGLPIPVEIERKFLVRNSCLHHPELQKAQKIFIEQVYLEPKIPGTEERIRRRMQGGHSVFYRTIKKPVSSGVREEQEWQITLEEYSALKKQAGHFAPMIRKYRWCFLYRDQYFELDDFSPMDLDLTLLEIELTQRNMNTIIPDWIKVRKEVTDDPSYSNHYIAHGMVK